MRDEGEQPDAAERERRQHVRSDGHAEHLRLGAMKYRATSAAITRSRITCIPHACDRCKDKNPSGPPLTTTVSVYAVKSTHANAETIHRLRIAHSLFRRGT
jgi:hypothetical protein